VVSGKLLHLRHICSTALVLALVHGLSPRSWPALKASEWLRTVGIDPAVAENIKRLDVSGGVLHSIVSDRDHTTLKELGLASGLMRHRVLAAWTDLLREHPMHQPSDQDHERPQPLQQEEVSVESMSVESTSTTSNRRHDDGDSISQAGSTSSLTSQKAATADSVDDLKADRSPESKKLKQLRLELGIIASSMRGLREAIGLNHADYSDRLLGTLKDPGMMRQGMQRLHLMQSKVWAKIDKEIEKISKDIKGQKPNRTAGLDKVAPVPNHVKAPTQNVDKKNVPSRDKAAIPNNTTTQALRNTTMAIKKQESKTNTTVETLKKQESKPNTTVEALKKQESKPKNETAPTTPVTNVPVQRQDL